jgi:hypothetical protein
MLFTSAILSLCSGPRTRLVEDDLWYLPVNAAGGFIFLRVCVSSPKGAREAGNIGWVLDFVGIGVLPGPWEQYQYVVGYAGDRQKKAALPSQRTMSLL